MLHKLSSELARGSCSHQSCYTSCRQSWVEDLAAINHVTQAVVRGGSRIGSGLTITARVVIFKSRALGKEVERFGFFNVDLQEKGMKELSEKVGKSN